mmetsp:Transcript_113707/g.170065  ORF Transcript_113707/g.170065 Transcript_113707/m.170065 type:complete len:407 (-) Transcript_113707:1170-2390(-)
MGKSRTVNRRGLHARLGRLDVCDGGGSVTRRVALNDGALEGLLKREHMQAKNVDGEIKTITVLIMAAGLPTHGGTNTADADVAVAELGRDASAAFQNVQAFSRGPPAGVRCSLEETLNATLGDRGPLCKVAPGDPLRSRRLAHTSVHLDTEITLLGAGEPELLHGERELYRRHGVGHRRQACKLLLNDIFDRPNVTVGRVTNASEPRVDVLEVEEILEDDFIAGGGARRSSDGLPEGRAVDRLIILDLFSNAATLAVVGFTAEGLLCNSSLDLLLLLCEGGRVVHHVVDRLLETALEPHEVAKLVIKVPKCGDLGCPFGLDLDELSALLGLISFGIDLVELTVDLGKSRLELRDNAVEIVTTDGLEPLGTTHVLGGVSASDLVSLPKGLLSASLELAFSPSDGTNI